MSLDRRSPLIFAHRGASALAPENTIAAFDLAIQEKADFIELDAKLSADQHVIVIHDQTVDRTTDGTGRVNDLPLSNLRQLDASANFPDFPGTQHIPTLQEVIETFLGKVGFNIELSNYASPFDALPVKVAMFIDYFAIHDQVLVSSFHPIPLLRLHQYLPSVPIAFLAKPGIAGALSRSALGQLIVPYQALHPEKRDITEKLVVTVHRSGRRVHPFTVNESDELSRLFLLGVDGVITDRPKLARDILEITHSRYLNNTV